LSLLPQESHLTLTGGTHVKWSPTWDYAETVWTPMLKKMGIFLQLSLKRAGFYPKGGGEVSVSISPAKQIFPLSLSKREGPLNAEGLISIHQVPSHVPARIQARTKQILQSIGLNPEFYVREYDAPSPGCAFLLTVKWEGGIAGFDSIGERRKPAEKVAEESAYTCLKFISTNATLDQHLADQLLLPAAFAKGTSEFRTPRITQHLLTNADVIQHFLPVKIEIEGELEHPGLVRVHPIPKSEVR
ncbi:MAG: RNA 3'-terminal phosphate cyclase, partial [Candidatus Caldarchaeum sp.]